MEKSWKIIVNHCNDCYHDDAMLSVCVCVDSVVAATQSSTYGTSQAASYAAVPGASPYGTTQAVVTPGAYAAPSGEQQYAQPAYGQPGD